MAVASPRTLFCAAKDCQWVMMHLIQLRADEAIKAHVRPLVLACYHAIRH